MARSKILRDMSSIVERVTDNPEPHSYETSRSGVAIDAWHNLRRYAVSCATAVKEIPSAQKASGVKSKHLADVTKELSTLVKRIDDEIETLEKAADADRKNNAGAVSNLNSLVKNGMFR